MIIDQLNKNKYTTMSESKPKVLIVGLGGVGIMAAYALEYGSKAEVTAVIRSDYDRVIEKGYELKSVDYGHIPNYKPSNVVKTVQDALKFGPFDYILVITKNIPDISNVEDIYADAVTPKHTTIILIQNGIGIEKPVFERFPGNVVLSGVSMISSSNFSGVVDHVSTDILNVGYFDNGVTSKEEQESKTREFIEIYSNGKNTVHYDEDVKYVRWRKLIYNATLNTICSIVNLDTGRMDYANGMESIIRPAMKEVIKVAKSDGVELDEKFIDFMIESDIDIYYAPSMLVDVRKGNQIESEVILGNVVRIAKENKVDIPILSTVYELIKLVQFRLKEANGYIKLPEVKPKRGE
ncbi:Glycerol-3-phosphate dehydrogenase [NAD(P)+] [Wickerhamomyces ciferrii]|uniref:2-dehydropantoate 2-reductase n=1 Tax=Wickerhamomyces ciferrii (strain ATCC 14091 / BCRC 22168 / CBS 111 / JCM 3599 / NBRC 0793 / NRRL Y-1031 F-60-10) TaxID=1206466 RepID=K0K6J6_WICCF|nr:Glycerol-3-phosphate dehydrogenase [NAD(P)+] [Wickerhamomyces ciferrii]CCH40555.1 Glycerol-3-phosphate dehydrogenase [NAD(P)+] [Wickerhamomyces ciferrii]